MTKKIDNRELAILSDVFATVLRPLQTIWTLNMQETGPTVYSPYPSAKRRREIFIFEVLTTTGARSRKTFILCLYMKTIRPKQAKVHSAYFVRRDQHGIIAKDLTQSSILTWHFHCSCCRSFLNSLLSSEWQEPWEGMLLAAGISTCLLYTSPSPRDA